MPKGKRLTKDSALRWALAFLVFGVLIRLITANVLWLSDDEAWYWALSERLDLSYTVHPPLSVWMIRLSTAIFGDNVFGVRLPAILCATLGAFWLLRLLTRMGWSKGSHVTAILCVSAPILFVGGILGGPDLPLFAFWCGMMERSYALGTTEKKLSAWLALGLYGGLALLSKYTAVLGIGAAGIWLLMTPAGRKAFRSAGPYIALVLAAALFAPVIYWNSQHDWSSFRFQFLDRHSGGELNLRRWGLFWLAQAFAFGPPVVGGWFVLLRGAFAKQKNSADRLSIRFLAVWALVPALVFFPQPLYSEFKIHWALFAFIPVLVYFAHLAAENPRPRLVAAAVGVSAALTIIGLFGLSIPVAPLATEWVKKKQLDPKYDSTNDFYGWDRLKASLARLPDDVSRLPLVASRYQIAAQAAFALGDKERVLILPHNSFELRDWGGPDAPPARFLYVTDNRYGEIAKEAFPAYSCSRAVTVRRHRWNYLAKEIRVDLCELGGAKPPVTVSSTR